MDHCFQKNIGKPSAGLIRLSGVLFSNRWQQPGWRPLGSIALPVIAAPTGQAPKKMPAKEEKEVWNACLVNCRQPLSDQMSRRRWGHPLDVP